MSEVINLTYKEILETVIDELTEKALSEFRKTNPLSKEITETSNNLNLTPEVENYIEKIYNYSAEEKDFLYVQGAKDCIVLLKKLGILA